MVQDPLWIRQLDAFFLEPPPDTHENFALDRLKAILWIVYPEPQLKIKGVVTEACQ